MRRLFLPLLALLPTTALAEGPVVLPAEPAPEVLDGLRWQAADAAWTIDRLGRRAAVAHPDPKSDRRSVVSWVLGDGPPASVQLRGRVVALQFDTAGSSLFALARREGKKGPSDAWLTRIDLARASAERVLGLPVGAEDLALWEAGGTLLVAGRNEIRSVLLPDPRSGPLYRIPGDNRAVAALHGSWEILVGQTDRLLRINLRDRQQRDAMPFRESVALPAASRSITASPDGRSAWVALDDGTVVEVSAEPLRLGASRRGDAVVWIGEPAAPPEEPVAIAAVEPEAEPETVVEQKPAPEPRPAPPPVVEKKERPKPQPKPKPEPKPAPPPVVEKKPEPEPKPKPRPGTAALGGQVRGQWSLVRAVVLLGPDSLLDEAARVPLDEQGRWRVDALPAGRYRIVLDGGGERVLAVRPAFRTVEVVEGSPLQVDDFEVTGTY